MRDKLGRFKGDSPTKIKCKVCDKSFYVFPCKKDTAKYCSNKCRWKNQKGKTRSKETIDKMRKNSKPNKGCFEKGKHSSPTTEFKNGEKHILWKGGKTKHQGGYILVHKPKHPFSHPNNYFFEHRFIMESHLGRYLDPKEVVHHINEIKTDNRLENLKLFKNASEHTKHHRSLIFAP